MKIRQWLICLICGVLAFCGVYTDVFRMADKTAEDVLYHHAGTLDGRIKIIKIDDRTMNRMGDFSTWQRDVYAQLVETLCVSEEVRPAVIGFDVLFSSEKDAGADGRFAEVCREYGNVVTGFSYVFGKRISTDGQGGL